MRDIRQDLKQRIAHELAQREPHQTALEEIDRNVADLTRLLDIEESRAHTGRTPRTAPQRPSLELDDYLMKMLGKSPKTLHELRDAAIAQGYFEEGSKESPGRAIHGKLLNPLRAGTIIRGEDKKYRLA